MLPDKCHYSMKHLSETNIRPQLHVMHIYQKNISSGAWKVLIFALRLSMLGWWFLKHLKRIFRRLSLFAFMIKEAEILFWSCVVARPKKEHWFLWAVHPGVASTNVMGEFWILCRLWIMFKVQCTYGKRLAYHKSLGLP